MYTMSKVFLLMPVAPMAELVWYAVAGIRADELFVIDSADNIGSTAPSRRYWRSFSTPFQVVYAFVGEQVLFLEFVFLVSFGVGTHVLLGVRSFYFLGEFEVDTRYQDLLRRACSCCGGLHLRAVSLVLGICITAEVVVAG